MHAPLSIDSNTGKKEKYSLLLAQIKNVVEGESNLIANLANVSSLLKHAFTNFSWVGFYIFDGSELVLGPFQGEIACTRIPIGKGVCGKAFEQKKTILVDNVNLFSGHIACSAETQSEVVVPILKSNKAVAVLDVDSHELSNFDSEDQLGLEAIAHVLSNHF